ncbi:MAG: hypothetical protein A3K46_00235, partial [Chloroflexi bacterium RBG_13_60_9]
MEATKVLKDEHRVIEFFLGALEIQAARLQSESPVRPEFFLDAIVFMRDFVDERHQRKEEETLCVALIEAGMAKDSGPIAELLADHARAREFWQAIEKHARILLGGGTNARLELARQAAGYVALLTGHIRAEEQNLFPSLQLIPTDVQAELAAEFE